MPFSFSPDSLLKIELSPLSLVYSYLSCKMKIRQAVNFNLLPFFLVNLIQSKNSQSVFYNSYRLLQNLMISQCFLGSLSPRLCPRTQWCFRICLINYDVAISQTYLKALSLIWSGELNTCDLINGADSFNDGSCSGLNDLLSPLNFKGTPSQIKKTNIAQGL